MTHQMAGRLVDQSVKSYKIYVISSIRLSEFRLRFGIKNENKNEKVKYRSFDAKLQY